MRRLVVLTVVAIVLAACGGGDEPSATSDDAAAAAPTATAHRIDASTEASNDGVGADAAWSPFEGDVDVEVGGGVRTDATGFAEVVYADGSLTRLDRDTTLELVALADSPQQPDVVVGMDVGRTWNRVKSIDGGGRFEVRTSVATAAVRGTAFVVDCAADGTCVFVVLEGSIDVVVGDTTVTLSPFERVEVGPDGTVGDVERLAPQEALQDEWVSRNLDRDDDVGFAPITGEGDDTTDAGPAPATGEDGPVASDGQPVTVGSVLAPTSGATAVIIRPDGSTADVALGVPQLISADWLPDGSIAYVDGGQLTRVFPDGSGTQTAGAGGYDTVTANLLGQIAVGQRQGDIDVVQVWDLGPPAQVVFEDSAALNRLQWPAISPDGATLAAVDFEGEALLLIDLASGAVDTRPAPLIDGWLRWSPDGARLVYTVNRSGVRFAGDDSPPGIVVHDVDTGTEQRFEGYMEADFLPDGTALVAASQQRVDQPPGSLMRIDAATGAVTEFRAGVYGGAIVFDGVTTDVVAWEFG